MKNEVHSSHVTITAHAQCLSLCSVSWLSWKYEDHEKFLMSILALMGLSQAFPTKDSSEEPQLQNLIWSLIQSNMKLLTKPKSITPSVLNKISGIHLPRPSKPFYPFQVRKDMGKLKEKWGTFEFQGFGPVTVRPWTFLDLRIIG